MKELRLELGLAGNLSNTNWNISKKYTTDYWLKSLLIYMHTNELKLNDTLLKLKTLRHDDKYIMEEAINLGYKGKILKRINKIRMFLEVITRAEICDAKGDFF